MDFRIEGELGSGAMGTVYRAVHVRLNRPVALKHISTPDLDPTLLARFQREIRLLSGLRHPNIVRFFDTGTLGGRPFFTMELVEGRTLHQCVVQEGPFSFERVLHLLEQAAEALAYLHERGLCHRDVKPSNLMVDRRDHLTLIDFGLLRNPGGRHLTAPGALMGTPSYMPPEAFLDAPPAPARDVYALGITVFEILAARNVFTSVDVTEIMPRIMRNELPLLGEHVPRLPPWFLELHRRCVDGEPAERPTAAGLVETLRRRSPDASTPTSLVTTLSAPLPSRKRAEGVSTGAADLPAGVEALGVEPTIAASELPLQPSARVRLPALVLALILAAGIAVLKLRDEGAPDPARPVPVLLPPVKVEMTLEAAGDRSVAVRLGPTSVPGIFVTLERPGPSPWKMTRPAKGSRAVFSDVSGGRPLVARAADATGREIGHTASWTPPGSTDVRDLLCSATESTLLVDFVLETSEELVVDVLQRGTEQALLAEELRPPATDFHHIFRGLLPGTDYTLRIRRRAGGWSPGPVPFRTWSLEQRGRVDALLRRQLASFPMTTDDEVAKLSGTPDPRLELPLAEKLRGASLPLVMGLRKYAWLAARLRSEVLVEPMLPLLDQEAEAVTRRAIVLACVAARHPRSATLLEQALSPSGSPDAVASFTDTIALRGGRAACELLASRALLPTTSPEVSRHVATRMVSCDPDHAVELFRRWVDHHQEENPARLAAGFSGLGLVSREEDVERLARHLTSGVPSRHEAAVRALVAMGTPGAAARLEGAYRKAPADLALTWAMGFGEGSAVGPLMRSRLTLGDSAPVREVTSVSLMARADREAIAEFRGQLDHPDGTTRERAAWALALLGDGSSAVRLLDRALSGEDPRGIAALALARLGHRPAAPSLLELQRVLATAAPLPEMRLGLVSWAVGLLAPDASAKALSAILERDEGKKLSFIGAQLGRLQIPPGAAKVSTGLELTGVILPVMPRLHTGWMMEKGDAIAYRVRENWNLPVPDQSAHLPWTRDARLVASIGEQDVPLEEEGSLVADRPGELVIGAWHWGPGRPWNPMPARTEGFSFVRLWRLSAREPLR